MKMPKCMQVLKYLAIYLGDLLFLAGVASVSFGVFQLSVPAGYIVMGLLIIGLACLVAKGRASGGGR